MNFYWTHIKMNRIIWFFLILGLHNCQLLRLSYADAQENSEENDLLPIPPDCGYRSESRRVVGGLPSEKHAWPWMAAIGWYKKSSGDLFYHCTGTLISNRYIVTAGHCFNELKMHVIATLGTTSLIPNDEAVIYAVKKIYIHPEYDRNNFNNDVALLKVAKEIEFTEAINPICLPIVSKRISRMNFHGVSAIIAGWGAVEFDGSMSDYLIDANIQVVHNSRCQNLFKNLNITSNNICAGVPGKSPCVGDSGGPLMYADGSIFYLIGIVSNGHACGEDNTPTVFMRASAYTDYFLNNME